jgi:hypothetical protein
MKITEDIRAMAAEGGLELPVVAIGELGGN